jgi:hypothetical protein
MPYHNPHLRAADWLLEVDAIAPTVVKDLTRSAIALREQARAAKTQAERDSLRYEAEGYYLEAERVIRATHGHSHIADEIDSAVWNAISAIKMPESETV